MEVWKGNDAVVKIQVVKDVAKARTPFARKTVTDAVIQSNEIGTVEIGAMMEFVLSSTSLMVEVFFVDVAPDANSGPQAPKERPRVSIDLQRRQPAARAKYVNSRFRVVVGYSESHLRLDCAMSNARCDDSQRGGERQSLQIATGFRTSWSKTSLAFEGGGWSGPCAAMPK